MGGRASERESESGSGGEAGQAGIESSQNNADGIEPGRHDTQSGEQHMGVFGRWLQLFGTHVHAEWNTIMSKNDGKQGSGMGVGRYQAVLCARLQFGLRWGGR